MPDFKIVSNYAPAGDQPRAIQELSEGIRSEIPYQTLLGVTGSGKTFTIANVIQEVQLPTLVMTHNKTLAAQLYTEFRGLFPNNAVEYFVSYYDYYQPEAYLPATDTYIAKDASTNDELEKLRLRATSSLLSRKDTLVVASVSCIYGLGSPEEYEKLILIVKKGEQIERNDILKKLISIQYTRNDIGFSAGNFRVRGDVIEILPAYEKENRILRIDMFGDEVEKISSVDFISGKTLDEMESAVVFPARHFVTTDDKIKLGISGIERELETRLQELQVQNKLVELQRLESRTNYDIEILKEIGYCSGIENYSRHFDGREPGSRPNTLLDFFPTEFLLVIDESHATLPQISAMYKGDRSRKEKLVDFGFRLPSALDNRPLKKEEFESLLDRAVFLSATPGDEELRKSGGVVVEQVVRPTGLVDPEVIIKPVEGQVDDLMEEIRVRTERNERTLVTTLTKKMAEKLSEYLNSAGIKVQYLHSEIDTLERTDIIRNLRKGKFDVLVGINLLREGLDIPETSLVAILDADKEGFLRSTTSLVQTSGRASRNRNGCVIMYADTITGSMKRAIEEMNRRREKQVQYNIEHNITPTTIYREIEERMSEKPDSAVAAVAESAGRYFSAESGSEDPEVLRNQMLEAAGRMDFEKAAVLRDKIKQLEGQKTAKSVQKVKVKAKKSRKM